MKNFDFAILAIMTIKLDDSTSVEKCFNNGPSAALRHQLVARQIRIVTSEDVVMR